MTRPAMTSATPVHWVARGRSCRRTTPATMGTTEYGAAAAATTDRVYLLTADGLQLRTER